jgi:hypothetical protein
MGHDTLWNTKSRFTNPNQTDSALQTRSTHSDHTTAEITSLRVRRKPEMIPLEYDEKLHNPPSRYGTKVMP